MVRRPQTRLHHPFREEPDAWGGPSSDHPVRWRPALPPLDSRGRYRQRGLPLEAGRERAAAPARLSRLALLPQARGRRAMLGGVREAPEHEKKVFCEGEWEKSATDGGEKGYDFAPFSWLV